MAMIDRHRMPLQGASVPTDIGRESRFGHAHFAHTFFIPAQLQGSPDAYKGNSASAFAIWRGSPPKRLFDWRGFPEKTRLIDGVVRNLSRKSLRSKRFAATSLI